MSLVGVMISIAFTFLTFVIYVLVWRYVERIVDLYKYTDTNTVRIKIKLNLFTIYLLLFSTFSYNFRYIKSDENIIMLNLCGSLGFSYVIFISAVEKTGNEVGIYTNIYYKKVLIYICIYREEYFRGLFTIGRKLENYLQLDRIACSL